MGMSELTLIIALASLFMSVVTLVKDRPKIIYEEKENVPPVPMVTDVPSGAIPVLQTDEIYIDGTEFDTCYARVQKAICERKPIILPANWSISWINIKEEKSEKPSTDPMDAPG